jgi:hypothetical protein
MDPGFGPSLVRTKYEASIAIRDPVVEIHPDWANYLTAGRINTLIDLIVKK